MSPKSTGGLRRLAKTARPLQEGTTAAPQRYRPAGGVPPDADTLIRKSHEEQITIGSLSRIYQTTPAAVRAVLAAAGRSREELWRPPRGSYRPAPRTLPDWDDMVRDYQDGDSAAVVAARYGVITSALHLDLRNSDDVRVRDRIEAQALLAQQRAEADEVRYRLRTGALEEAARDLGVLPGDLFTVLEAHGVILHGLTEAAKERCPVTETCPPVDRASETESTASGKEA